MLSNYLTPPHNCACSKPGPALLLANDVAVFYCLQWVETGGNRLFQARTCIVIGEWCSGLLLSSMSWGRRWLITLLVLVDLYIVVCPFCPFSFFHCVVCSTSIYEFWCPLWHLQTLVDHQCLNVLLIMLIYLKKYKLWHILLIYPRYCA